MTALEQYEMEFHNLLSEQRDILQEKWLLEEDNKKFTPSWNKVQDRLMEVNHQLWEGTV